MTEVMGKSDTSTFVSDDSSDDDKKRSSYPIGLNLSTGKPDVKYL